MDGTGLCAATRVDGTPCRVARVRDSTFCFAHIERAAEGRARGGRNSRQALHTVDQTPMPATLRPILRKLGRIFDKAAAGTIKPEQARACAQVATAMARLVTVGTLEERMSQLEQRMQQPTPEPERKTG